MFHTWGFFSLCVLRRNPQLTAHTPNLANLSTTLRPNCTDSLLPPIGLVVRTIGDHAELVPFYPRAVERRL